MKCKFIVIFVFLITGHVFAQEWQTNFENAKALASKSNHNIVLVFQGSDWCAPCMKLDKEIWSSSEFQNLSKNHFIMFKADFPRKKANKLSDDMTAQNTKLAEMYNSQGFFPLVVVLDKNGKVLGKTGYQKLSPNDYYKKLTSFETSL
ncbi:MAG: thioredoxin family protein [Flavobacteriaceae bacterium]|nr:thioredoxin family protein [Flavobacteriaceae bacterium]